MADRAMALLAAFMGIIGAMAVQPSAAGAAPGDRGQEITFTVIAPPGSVATDLSERGHVVYSMGRQAGDDQGAYRWYRGESVRLTPYLMPDVQGAWPSAVNRWGTVVGNTWDVGGIGSRGFEWSDGVFTPLPPRPDFSYSSTVDINDFGAVLVHRGEGDCCSPTWRAAVRFGDHEVTSPLLADQHPLYGLAINNWGTVIGVGGQGLAYRWQPGTDPMPLLPEGATGSSASEINDRGTVLGAANQTFLWRRGRFTDVDLMLSDPLGRRPDRLNNRDQVVGFVFENFQFRAALWSRGRVIHLGDLGGGYSEALGINDRGEVVGRSSRADGSSGAFLWRDGTMIDLGALTGAPRSEAFAINNRGQVLGEINHGDDYSTRQPVVWETRQS
jgi:probable HAF family extracellular repeat protein